MSDKKDKIMDQTNASPGTNKNSNWPIDSWGTKHIPSWLTNAACVALILAVLLLLFLTATSFVQLTLDLLGSDVERSSDATRSLLPITAAAIGLPLIIWRLIILNKQTNILNQQARTSEAKTQIDRETHYTNIFSKSVEQLGQTREIKESRQSGAALETLTRTVANIEMRLGGIHSLTRLAEESTRDAAKIENMLLSYIRENSWTNRDGSSAERRIRTRRFASWQSGFQANKVTEDTAKKHEKWVIDTDASQDAERKWFEQLQETRVDVNEAIDAVVAVRTQNPELRKGILFESLLAGRSFKPPALRSCDFERCTFFRCHFDISDINQITFVSCNFFDCTFSVTKSDVRISGSFMTNCEFSTTDSSSFKIYDGELIDTNFWDILNCKMHLEDLEMNSCWLTGSTPREIELYVSEVSFSKCRFMDLILTNSSSIRDSAFAMTQFQDADLSEVLFSPSHSLETTETIGITMHPVALPRPSSWPPLE